jgi:hypothetical protein
LNSKEFQSLKDKWYLKLEQSGFQDIEFYNGEGMLRYDGYYFQDEYTPDQFLEKKKYFEQAKELLQRDIFLNKIERSIWELHSNGCSIKNIIVTLRKMGISPLCKDSVEKVLKEFKRFLFK